MIRIRIGPADDDDGRMVSHNDAPSHSVDGEVWKGLLEEASTPLWARFRDHGYQLGQSLYEALNGNGGLLEEIFSKQRQAGTHEPLRLDIPDELMELPFEVLADASGFVGQTFPILREVSDRHQRKSTKPAKRAIRMLFMACAPIGTQPELKFEAEEEAISKQLEEDHLPVTCLVEESGSLQGLKLALKQWEPIDVVHLSGHAAMTEGGPVFEMESETGEKHAVAPGDLWLALRNREIQLLFLSGCETGQSRAAAAVSFAQAMVRLGVPQVLGWGLRVSDDGATSLAKNLYRALGDGLALDRAVLQTRQDLVREYEAWCQLRAFADAAPMQPLADPVEKVVYQSKRQERYHFLQQSQVKVLEYGFVGRRREIQRGLRVLLGAVPGKYGLLITGVAGVGKSTLAGKLIAHFQDRELVVISGEIEPAAIIGQLNALFDKNRDSDALAKLAQDAPFEKRIKDLFAGPFQTTRTLLVFDDFEQNLVQKDDTFVLKPGKAGVLLPFLQGLEWAKGHTQLIVTCRYPFSLERHGREWLGFCLEPIPLLSLRGAALRKKKANLQHLSKSPHHQAYEQFSGGNPRLLEWFEKLAQENAVPDLQTLERDLAAKGEEFVQKYLAEVLAAAQDEAFQAFLAKASVYRQPVPVSAFASFGGRSLLEKAVGLTLMEKEGQAEPLYWVMPLLRAQFWAKVEDPAEVHRQASDWYQKQFEAGKGLEFADMDAAVHHAEHGYRMKGRWKPAITLSKYFYEKAMYREGVRRLERLQAFFTEMGTESFDPEEVVFINNLASIFQAANHLEKAEPLKRLALALDEKSSGPNDPKVAIRLNNLAALLQATNRLAEAEPLMLRALAIDEAAFYPNHPKVAIRLNNLAQLLKATNRLEEAEPLMRRALAIDEAALGLHHPEVAVDLNNLATLLLAANRLSEAEPLMRRALAIDEANLGPHHPDVAIDLNNLARLLQATNRLAEAEPLMRRALAIFRASLGEDHPNTQIVARNYLGLLAEIEASKQGHRDLDQEST